MEDDDIPIVRKNMAAMGHKPGDLGSKLKSGTDIKKTQQGKRAVLDTSSQMKGKDPDSGDDRESVPTLTEGSSVIVIGPDGKEITMTVGDFDKQQVQILHATTDNVYLDASSGVLEPQLGGEVDNELMRASQNYVHTSSSVDMGDSLSRLSQYQVEPPQAETPSTSTQLIQMPTKKIKQQNFLTLKQKYDLCRWHADNPHYSLDDIVNHFEPLLGRRIPKSTLSTVFAKSHHYLALDPDSPSTWTRKKMGSTDSELFEDKLYKWVWQQIQLGGKVTTKAIGDKAIQLANESGYTEFVYSPMWVQVFLNRFKLRDKIN